MNLSKETLDWIDKTTNILNLHSKKKDNYVAFEGLPCAGKTSVINYLKQLTDYYTVDEVRLPLAEESCLAYISRESARTKRILGCDSSLKKIIGDRCIISTLAHKASLLTYNDSVNFDLELEKLENLAMLGDVILPQNIITLQISTEISRQRQAIRDRDRLDGRLWYEPKFLDIISAVTEKITAELYINSNKQSVDSQNQSLDKVISLIKQII